MAVRAANDRLERRRNRYGYVFTAPFILGAVLAIVYPVVLSMAYSVSKIIPQTIGYKLEFVGLSNYHHLFFVNSTFFRQLLDTLKNTLINVPVTVIFSFFLACVLNAEFKGRGTARAILFLPLILCSRAVMALASGDVVSGNLAEKREAGGEAMHLFSGAFTGFLEKLSVDEGIISLLTSSVNNIGNLLAMSVIPTIVILAGLQSVSRSVYEAAFVEGATAWEVLWKISLPIVSPILLVSVVYCVIDSFTSTANVVISLVRTECFSKYNFGLGSAMAWSYLLVVLAIIGVVYLIVNRFVSYDT